MQPFEAERRIHPELTPLFELCRNLVWTEGGEVGDFLAPLCAGRAPAAWFLGLSWSEQLALAKNTDLVARAKALQPKLRAPTAARTPGFSIAYFSAEFGLHEALP